MSGKLHKVYLWYLFSLLPAVVLLAAVLPTGDALASQTAPTATISGTIVNPDGSLLNEAATVCLKTVEENGIWGEVIQCLESDSTGHFEFHISLAPYVPGRFLVRGTPPENSSYFSTLPAYFMLESDSQIVTLGSLKLTYASFEGTVYEPDGVTPAGDGTIMVEMKTQSDDGDKGDNECYYVVATGEYHNGTYSIGGIPTGQVWITAGPPDDSIYVETSKGPFTVAMGSQYDPDEAQQIDLTLNSPNFYGTVVYPNGDRVEWILDSTNGERIGWAEVQAWNEYTADWENAPRSTDSAGNYGLNLGEADYDLIARPMGRLVDTYTRSIPQYIEQDEIPGSAVLTLTYPAVAGPIVDPENEIITDCVQVWVEDDEGQIWSEANCAVGIYALGGLPEGQYSLQSDGLTERNLFPANPYYFYVDEESQYLPTVTQYITLQLTSPQVMVNVIDPDGDPVTATVHLWDGSADDEEGNNFYVWSRPGEPAYFGGFEVGEEFYLQAIPHVDYIPLLANSPITAVTIATDTIPITLVLNTPNVTGRVVQPNGDPLAATGDEEPYPAILKAVDEYGDWELYSPADDEGYFSLWLPPGADYYLTAYPKGETAYSYTHSLIRPISLIGTNVPPVTDLGDVRLTYPRVKGIVLPPHGSHLDGCASVWLENLDGGVVDESEYCGDGDQMYMLGGVEAGDYWLIADGENYYPSAPILIHVEPESQYDLSSTEIINIRLLDEAGISGYVVDCDDYDTRLEGIFVVAHDDEWLRQSWDMTDDEGEFHIGGVISGETYILEAYPGWNNDDYLPSPPVEVVPITHGVRLEMCRPVTNIVGIVHDPDGNIVPDSWAVLWNDYYWDETTADEAGRFRFRGTLTGTFNLHVGPPWGSTGLIAASPFSVTVPTPDSLIDVGVITLPWAHKLVTGYVYYQGTTNGVMNAEVRAYQVDGAGFAIAPVEEDGSFILGLSGGEWYLSVGPIMEEQASWLFPGPPVLISFQLPEEEPETIPDVILEVVEANSRIEGQILCPGDGGPTSCAELGLVLPGEIWVEADDHMSNGIVPDENFHFSIPVHPGWYEVSVYVDHPDIQGPEEIPVSVGPGETVDLGDLVLFTDNALITGHVYDGMGNPVEGVDVVAWRSDETDWDRAETDANGVYTLTVIGGQWFVEPEPAPDLPYVFTGDPRPVDVAANGLVTGVDFDLHRADARIKGIAVDENTGERIWDLYGRAWSEFAATGEFFSDAEVQDGAFLLKASGGYTYDVGIDVSPYEGYVSGWRGPIAVEPGSVTTVTVPLPPKDASITGHLLDGSTGEPVDEQLWATIFGDDEDGHWTEAFVGDDGRYEMEVVSGTWILRAWVDPETGYVASPDPLTVTIHSEETITRDFEIWPIGALITGTVLAPDGSPLTTTAFVYAEGESPFTGYFETYTETDESGYFALYVPAGTYSVGAGLPEYEMEERGWMPPLPVEVPWVSPDDPAEGVELRFRQIDGLITGTVTFTSTANVTATHPAYVWGWADNGGWMEVDAPVVSGTNTFTYSMPVISGTVWHIGALYEDWEGGRYYESTEITVPVGFPDCQVTQDLVLEYGGQMLQPFMITFDGSQMQTIMMPDGVELIIPPGALVVSGTVTLYILPTNELPGSGGDRMFIGTGYKIWAVDQYGRQSTYFNKPVKVKFPYPPDDVLEALGIDETQLVPVYYSTLVGDWVLADGYVLDTTNNKVVLRLTHFSKWGLAASGPKSEGGTALLNKVYLPLVMRDFGGG